MTQHVHQADLDGDVVGTTGALAGQDNAGSVFRLHSCGCFLGLRSFSQRPRRYSAVSYLFPTLLRCCVSGCDGEEAERVVKKHVFCIKSAQPLVKAAGYGKTADMPPLLVSLLSVRLPERAALCRNAPTAPRNRPI